MGASFRSKGEVLELAGSDLLTISPQLLGELQASTEPVERKLSPAMAAANGVEKLSLDERAFRWRLNEDAMATEKLAEGIRLFNADALKLKKYLASLLT
jgi:transaldolase